MLSINDLKSGSLIMIEGAPYQVLEVSHLHMGRGGSSVQSKIRNLKTGQTYNRNFKPSDTFSEADVEKRPLKFLYHHRGEFVFEEPKNSVQQGEARPQSGRRFPLPEDVIGANQKWLKPNTELTAVFMGEELLNLIMPIKMDLKVTEAPPGIQGDRSSAGTKSATIETGAIIQVPLFINTGDVIRVNTETGEYVERAEKA